VSYAFGVVALMGGLILSIGLHELGHLAAARRFGVKVTDFMVGFGPKVWGRLVGETQVGLRLIPLGGYIKMIGMYPPHSRLGVGEHAELDPVDRQRVFHAIHPFKKIIVMVAGPAMNLVLALFLLAVAAMGIGLPTATNQVGALTNCADAGRDCVQTPAQSMGLRPGDVIVGINGEVSSWAGVVAAIDRHAGGEVEVVVERGGELTSLLGVLDGSGGEGYLGIAPATSFERLGAGMVVEIGLDMITRTGEAVMSFPRKLVELVGVVLGGEPRDPAGPVGVVGLARLSGEFVADADQWRSGALDVILLLAGLNMSLFVFNLIPLVPLDGGNALTALIELVRRGWARMRGGANPPAVDGARLLPLTYTVAIGLLAMALLVTVADIIEPMSIR
jgi:membrane-associated protease RseP (regulator of RpoE activity)